MKQLGISRKLDELGRIVIPVDVRRAAHVRGPAPMYFRKVPFRRHAAAGSVPVGRGGTWKRK